MASILLKTLVKVDYNKINENYFESTTPFVTKIFRNRLEIALALAQLKDDLTILDVGSSYGYFIMMIHSLYPSCKCYGIDNDPDWVGRPAEFIPNCTFKVANAANMPFKNEYFDVVFALDVIEHIRNIDPVIKEIHRVLKPNGLAILSGPTESWFYKFCRYMWTRQWDLPGHIHDVQEIEKKYESNGFQLIKRKSLPGIPLPELFRISKYKKLE